MNLDLIQVKLKRRV